MPTNVRFTGRIVWGHPTEGKGKVDQKTKQPVMKDGVQVIQRAFGVAVPSDQFVANVWPAMAAEAMRFYPGGNFPADFAWKFKDSKAYDKGDATKNRAPKLYSDREGWAGCHVITISSELPDPVACFQLANGAFVQVPGTAIKCGDFVEVNVDIDGHLGQSPGLYINPKGVQLTGIGAAIVTGSDPNEMFSGQPAPLPAGATPPPMPGFTPPAPGASTAPALPGPLPGAPVAAPPPATPAAPPPMTPGLPPMPTASPSNPGLPPMPGQPAAAPPVPGFSTGAPQLPGQPPAVAPPPVAAPPPARVPTGYAPDGRPYFFNPTTGQNEW